MNVALRLLNRSGYTSAEADGRAELAEMLRHQGRFAESIAEHGRALELAERQGERLQLSRLRCDLATTLRHSGDLAAARELYESALTIGTKLRVAYLVADARAGLGALQDATSGSVVRTVARGETMVA